MLYGMFMDSTEDFMCGGHGKKGKKITSMSSAVFACHSAACRPPTSGGTGGSDGGNGGMGGGSMKGASAAGSSSGVANNRRLKPGQKVSIKSSSGGRRSIGSVKRDKSGKSYEWVSKIDGIFGAMGSAKSYAQAQKLVQGTESHTQRLAGFNRRDVARANARLNKQEK